MRSRDWSSDVCSSDLQARPGRRSVRALARVGFGIHVQAMRMRRHLRPDQGHGVLAERLALRPRGEPGTLAGAAGAAPAKVGQSEGRFAVAAVLGAQQRKQRGVLRRSEEHTSELQSLMRISYAVFCLKKKTNKHTNKIKQYEQNQAI